MGKRKEATEFIVKYINKLDPNNKDNGILIKEHLDSLSDKEFEEYMHKLSKPKTVQGRQTQAIIPYVCPNFTKHRMSVDRNFEIAKELGHNFFERLWLTCPKTGRVTLTKHEHLVVDLMVRRQAQIHDKKSNIPMDDHVVDDYSGQVTGDSKGSKLSFPELQLQSTNGLDNTIIEEIKIRGGDEVAFNEFEKELIETGSCSLNRILDIGTKTRSTEVTSILLKGMHYDNNL